LLVPPTLPSRSADKTRNFYFRSFQPSLLVPTASRARLSGSFASSGLFGSKNERNQTNQVNQIDQINPFRLSSAPFPSTHA
jgi:hypothetical protein